MLFDRFLSTPEMGAAFDDRTLIQAMLDFEAALSQAQAELGVIPAAAAACIRAACRAERFDVDALVADGSRAGSLAIPLVRQLTAAVSEADAAAGGLVHWGSTSQDVLDSALVLCTRRALALVDRDLGALTDALLAQAQRHRDAPILARTLLQPAQVVSFGYKLVAWIAPLLRARTRLRAAGDAALQLQLGGAVGTLAVMGADGPRVAQRMAAALGLGAPLGAWHTQRDSWVALGCEAGLLCGSLGKIAADLALLAQAEIGELAEPAGAGRGGSSAMPHKRNPVAAMIGLAAATRAPQRVAALLAAMPQQHERGMGNWQAELAEWPGLWASLHGSLRALGDAAAGLEVDTARMRSNIDSLRGLVYAEAASMLLARQIGKSRAHALLEGLSKRTLAEQGQLRELTLAAVAADPALLAQIDVAALRAVFDADSAARLASTHAQAQLDAITVQAAELNRSAPWPALPPRQEMR